MRRSLTSAAVLALALAAAFLPAAPGTATADGPAPVRFHTPAHTSAAYAQYRELLARGERSDAAGLLAMIRTPHAVWLGDGGAAETEAEARDTVRAAAREGTVPVFVVYDIPGRDCAGYSGGGVGTTAAYRAWIDAVARGIGASPALVVLEPDGLALLPSDCGQDDAAGTRTAARYAELGYAVDTLDPLAGTRVYLDAGHPGWHTVNSLVARLIRAGAERATGFAVNVSNHHTDAASTWYGRLISSCLGHATAGGDPAACPNQRTDPRTARDWLARHPGVRHFVTDSSRNGRGPWTAPAGRYSDPQDWCNPPGRGVGARPTAATGDPLHDARLWIKTPGESDGLCLRGTAGPLDPERRTADPAAGEWFPAQALELVRLAVPALPTV
ncbi:glycoside hydrolase family 6 protein [Streptomyces sp. NPDC048629]|uniref:glycoside hydrolase family 6 protein n=1 Tax=Streptomyces sp. NPDC048629 TaxID=3154824 RepID=UPI00342CCEF9